MSPALNATLSALQAVQALGAKPHHCTTTSDGVLITKPGKPAVLLTYAAIKEWAEQMGLEA